MCKHCLREAFPERQRTTLERGAYMMNFTGCNQCKLHNDFLIERNRKREEEDDDENNTYEESIDYEHACKSCGHKVADHSYVFRVISNGEIQEFSMSCALCGKGEDSTYSAPNKSSQAQIRNPSSGSITGGSPAALADPVTFPVSMLAASFAVKASVNDDSNDDEWN